MMFQKCASMAFVVLLLALSTTSSVHAAMDRQLAWSGAGLGGNTGSVDRAAGKVAARSASIRLSQVETTAERTLNKRMSASGGSQSMASSNTGARKMLWSGAGVGGNNGIVEQHARAISNGASTTVKLPQLEAAAQQKISKRVYVSAEQQGVAVSASSTGARKMLWSGAGVGGNNGIVEQHARAISNGVSTTVKLPQLEATAQQKISKRVYVSAEQQGVAVSASSTGARKMLWSGAGVGGNNGSIDRAASRVSGRLSTAAKLPQVEASAQKHFSEGAAQP